MQRQSPAALALRAAVIVLIACGFVAGGALLDRIAGTSPIGLLFSLAVGITYGMIMIYVSVTSSFPKTARSEDTDNRDEPGE